MVFAPGMSVTVKDVADRLYIVGSTPYYGNIHLQAGGGPQGGGHRIKVTLPVVVDHAQYGPKEGFTAYLAAVAHTPDTLKYRPMYVFNNDATTTWRKQASDQSMKELKGIGGPPIGDRALQMINKAHDTNKVRHATANHAGAKKLKAEATIIDDDNSVVPPKRPKGKAHLQPIPVQSIIPGPVELSAECINELTTSTSTAVVEVFKHQGM